MPSPKPSLLVRTQITKLSPYVPGEQPSIKNLIKLNTNENPYPPSAKVLATVRAAVDGRLRLYPNPTAQPLREKLAKLHQCDPDNIIIGNGSDELLAIAVRVFSEPAPAWLHRSTRRGKSLVQYFSPSYSLYPVLADIHGAAKNEVRLNPDFTLPRLADLKRGREWAQNCALTFITTPNAPSGRGYATADLEIICQNQNGVVILDEAYADFAEAHALSLALKYKHVIVSRTFSKAYSLCFQRVGYFVGDTALIAAMHKVRDSYNVNGLGQLAAEATLDDLPYYRKNFKRIIETRNQLARDLRNLDFLVSPSETNFLLARPPVQLAGEWLEKLRERKILVRWFKQPELTPYLRITVGTPEESEALLKAVRTILGK